MFAKICKWLKGPPRPPALHEVGVAEVKLHLDDGTERTKLIHGYAMEFGSLDGTALIFRAASRADAWIEESGRAGHYRMHAGEYIPTHRVKNVTVSYDLYQAAAT